MTSFSDRAPATAMKARAYEGPQCPFCRMPFSDGNIPTGLTNCTHCFKEFEATAFQPPVRKPRVLEVIQSGPEGANACATHARNAAVASCSRCGLFICSLCEMNVGDGSYCPACFERLRTDGSLNAAKKYRDFGSMAWVAAIIGLPCAFIFLGIAFGPAAIVYAIRGRRQRIERGVPTVSVWLAGLLGLVELGISGAMIIALLAGTLFS